MNTSGDCSYLKDKLPTVIGLFFVGSRLMPFIVLR